MYKKILSIFSIVILLLSFSIGCNDSENTSEDSSAVSQSSEAEDVAMNMTYWDPGQKDIMETINNLFIEDNPNVTIELQQIPSDQYDQVLKTRFLSDTGPDAYMYYGGGVYKYAKDGYFGELTNESFADTIIEGYKGTCSYDGKLYAVPLNAWANSVLYNKAVFEEAGITENPKTYEEFLEICEKIKQAGKVPIARGGKDLWTTIHEIGPLYSLIFAQNENFQMDRYEKTISFSSSPAYRTFVQRYIDIVDKGYTNEGSLGMNHTQAMQLIADGEAAMTLGISVFYGEIKGLGDNVELGYFPLPDSDGSVAYVGNSDKAIGYWPNTPNKDMAIELISFYASPEINKLYCEATQMLPAIKDVDVDLDEPLKQLAAELSASENVFGEIGISWPQPSYDVYQRAMRDIHSGSTDIDAILAELDQSYDDNLEGVEPPKIK